jgi:four helix bundle protein
MFNVSFSILSLNFGRCWRCSHRKDASLENQLRRAMASVALNLAEGVGSFGGIKKQRYRTALGSLHEVVMALELARSLGYVTAIDGELAANLARAGRMIAGLARR